MSEESSQRTFWEKIADLFKPVDLSEPLDSPDFIDEDAPKHLYLAAEKYEVIQIDYRGETFRLKKGDELELVRMEENDV